MTDIIVGWALIGAALTFLATALLVRLCRAAARPTPNAAPAPEVEPVQGRAATRCTVPFCDDRVQVLIPVGIGDKWEFCLTHGLPYLTAESARERKGGAA